MSRYTRNTFIRALLETEYGEAQGSWSGTPVILVSNPDQRIVRDVVPRELVRPWLGGSEHLIGARVSEISFDVELAGSGTLGTAPAWGPLLRACGMAQTIFDDPAGPTNRVEYTPVSTAMDSIAFMYIKDGIHYTCRGARGNVDFTLDAYQRPMMKFRFVGFDTIAGTTAASFGGSSYTAWQRPVVVSDGNSGDIRLGGTYADGIVSGGTVLPSRGINFDLGNQVEHIKLLGGESVDITNRDATGNISVALTAAQELTWRTDINANTTLSLGFNHGTTAGHRIAIFAPNVQRIDPQNEDFQGRALIKAELRLLPSGNGNNEVRIVAR